MHTFKYTAKGSPQDPSCRANEPEIPTRRLATARRKRPVARACRASGRAAELLPEMFASVRLLLVIYAQNWPGPRGDMFCARRCGRGGASTELIRIGSGIVTSRNCLDTGDRVRGRRWRLRKEMHRSVGVVHQCAAQAEPRQEWREDARLGV